MWGFSERRGVLIIPFAVNKFSIATLSPIVKPSMHKKTGRLLTQTPGG